MLKEINILEIEYINLSTKLNPIVFLINFFAEGFCGPWRKLELCFSSKKRIARELDRVRGEVDKLRVATRR